MDPTYTENYQSSKLASKQYYEQNINLLSSALLLYSLLLHSLLSSVCCIVLYCIVHFCVLLYFFRDLLSEFDYWQFWRNTADNDVVR